MREVQVHENAETLAAWAADVLIDDLQRAAERRGQAIWVAAGGSTPKAAYKLLAARSSELPWSELVIAMGDERCVPIADTESNWGQLEQELLAHSDTSGTHLLVPQADLVPEEAAERYEEELRLLPAAGADVPRLDHVWLGMGEDGHTLSLFPGHPVTGEVRKLVAAVHNSPKPPPDRITLTFRALQGADHCVILAAGAGKRDPIARALNGDESLPIGRAAQVVEEAGGHVTWALDEAAASALPAR